MNFTHLEYAVEVAKQGSISRAAQELFVPQPYLSNTIKKLEEELGFPILTVQEAESQRQPPDNNLFPAPAAFFWNCIKSMSSPLLRRMFH